ncbi:hypothetical protein BVE84_02965 [Streptococcus azizii]|uniref:Uncharacterized protein n=1 Tax=Streptococcus azizii TaxID=1579424 RepID=A0AB36JPB6_9STRE|nr:hypothetical protein BVE86_01655 [Streptococcus azizii]ONK29767.1 hypothetical protein BVE85_02970 [Streptococcus azizii]ONK30705.1 hypothetical protein BVE84_02965 [Streptococcus azizii]
MKISFKCNSFHYTKILTQDKRILTIFKGFVNSESSYNLAISPIDNTSSESLYPLSTSQYKRRGLIPFKNQQ